MIETERNLPAFWAASRPMALVQKASTTGSLASKAALAATGIHNMSKAMVLGKREAHRQQTHSALVNAATALFLRDGYENTTLEQVAARAGVHVQTLYRYFNNKESLALDLIARMHQGLLDSVSEKSDHNDVVSRMSKTLTTALKKIDSNEQFLQFYRMTESVSTLKAYNLLLYKTCEQRLAETLQTKFDDALKAKAIATLTLNAFWEALQQWGESQGKIKSASSFRKSMKFISSTFSH